MDGRDELGHHWLEEDGELVCYRCGANYLWPVAESRCSFDPKFRELPKGRRRPYPHAARDKAIAEKFRRGASRRDLAIVYNVTAERVRQILVREGIL